MNDKNISVGVAGDPDMTILEKKIRNHLYDLNNQQVTPLSHVKY